MRFGRPRSVLDLALHAVPALRHGVDERAERAQSPAEPADRDVEEVVGAGGPPDETTELCTRHDGAASPKQAVEQPPLARGQPRRSLVPVDLNCLLVDLERALAKAYRMRGDVTHAENMAQRAASRADTIRRVLWDPQLQAFGDYNFDDRVLTHRLTAATVYPLYTGVANRQQATTVAATLQREP